MLARWCLLGFIGESELACGLHPFTDSTFSSSLVTTLRAAEKFDPSHLSSPEIAPLVEGATHFYIGGFFLTHGVKSALIVGKQASTAGKTVILNLSAPFLCQFFKVQLEQIFAYADIIIGNESEAAAWADASGLPVGRLVRCASLVAEFRPPE